MDLRKEILKEHSKKQTTKIADYVSDNADRFKALVEIYLQGPDQITQRSAWPLSICVEHSPELLRPHLKSILDFLRKPRIHNAVKRNTMRLLQFVDIPKRFHGRITTICFEYLQSNKEPIAVKVFSMTVLSNIIKVHPELKQELIIILEDQFPFASAGFRSRAKKILQELKAGSSKIKGS